MSLTPSNVPWDSNRLKATEYVIKYDSTGKGYLEKQEADYTGVNYNFASLPTDTSTTTSGVTTGTTAQTTQQQTSEAFGDVRPHYWDEKDNDAGNKELTGSSYGGVQPPDNTLSGFFKPLEDAAQGKKIGSLGARIKQKFEDITGKTERDWEDVDRDIEIDGINEQLKKGGLDYEEEEVLRNRLAELSKGTFGSKIGKAPQVLGLGVRTAGKVIGGVFDAILGVTEADRQRQRHAKQYFRKKGIKTRGELGESRDPGRIVGNPSKDLFAGMNEISAKGDLSRAGSKRITTRNSKKTQDRLINRYGANSEKVKEFNQNTKNMEIELSNFNNDKKDYDHRTTPGVADQNRDSGSGRDDAGNPGGSSGAMTDDNAGTFCFDPDTCIQMIDGSKKEIKNIQLGDDTKGGEVTGIFQFKPTDEIHDYKGVKVAGSHYVKEDGKFIMVQDSPLSVKIDKIPVVYSLDTTGRRIFINDIEFADYNGDGIAKGFLHNAGLNINGFNKEVLRQVEQRLI